MAADPKSVTDLLGPTPKLARRVAVKVRDEIRLRNLVEHAQAVVATSKPVKDPGAEDIQRLQNNMVAAPQLSSGAEQTVWEDAAELCKVREICFDPGL